MKQYPHIETQPEMENSVHFIQFMFPDGRRDDQWIPRPKEIVEMAKELWRSGFSLEIENDNERIWMSCVNHKLDQAIDRVCTNGRDVPDKVDELIKDAYIKFVWIP